MQGMCEREREGREANVRVGSCLFAGGVHAYLKNGSVVMCPPAAAISRCGWFLPRSDHRQRSTRQEEYNIEKRILLEPKHIQMCVCFAVCCSVMQIVASKHMRHVTLIDVPFHTCTHIHTYVSGRGCGRPEEFALRRGEGGWFRQKEKD